MTWRVLIGSKSFGKTFPEHLDQLRGAGCEVIPNGVGRPYLAPELREALRGVDAVVTGTDELTAAVLAGTDRLRHVAKHGVGLDTIHLPTARARGMVVTATFGAVHDSVADLTLALLLAVARRLVPAHLATMAGGWKGLGGMELRGKTLGIVGLGRIGKEVAVRARAFGMRIVAHDPFQDAAFAAAHEVRYVTLAELLATADAVTLHAGLEQAGKALLGAEEIATMKRGALLVNTGRGHLVDEAALAAALRDGRLGGAGLDVFQREPPKGSPLLAAPNVVAVPHIGGETDDARRRLGEITVENVLRVMRGERPIPGTEVE